MTILTVLKTKPDLHEVADRWEASFNGELIDRPPVYIVMPKHGIKSEPTTYVDCIQGDIETVIDKAICHIQNHYWLADAVPQWRPDFGPDSVALYTGQAELEWDVHSPGTTWVKPLVDNWIETLPIALDPNNRYWRRVLEFYRKAAKSIEGIAFLKPPDLHTNLDLLSAIRGPENLCMDLLDAPDMIDSVMGDARTYFHILWNAISDAGKMQGTGYADSAYSPRGTAMLQCDFSCMINSDMYKRWALPALEDELSIVGNGVYHWDGPGALTHAASVFSIDFKGISYVPGAGNGSHVNHLDLLKAIQSAGRVAHIAGTIEEIKYLHKQLKPELCAYFTTTETLSEAEELIEWLKQNT